MKGTLDRRGLLRSAAATGSLLVCYGVLDRSARAASVRITPPVVDSLTIQVVLDTNHDIFITGAQAPGVGVKRVRSPASFSGRTLESEWGLSLHLTSTRGDRHETHHARLRLHAGRAQQQP
jgi:7,8-dihydropterin-6-yl-methyl-4-(beta-D-ribofuranosyl)aminobenzene 5'-phosphate synthase